MNIILTPLGSLLLYSKTRGWLDGWANGKEIVRYGAREGCKHVKIHETQVGPALGA